MNAPRSIVAYLSLLLCLALAAFYATRTPTIASPPGEVQPAIPSSGAIDRNSEVPHINRVEQEGSEQTVVRFVDQSSKQVLTGSWMTFGGVTLEADSLGEVTDQRLVPGLNYVAGCEGYIREHGTIEHRTSVVELDPVIRVSGFIRFEDQSAPDPSATSLRMVRSGRNVLDDGFESAIVPLGQKFEFEFTPSDSRQQTVRLLRRGVEVGRADWTYPLDRIELVASIPKELTGSVKRTVIVECDEAFLSTWKERATKIYHTQARISLQCTPSGGYEASLPTTRREYASEKKSIVGNSTSYEVSLPDGMWDIMIEDHCQNTSYPFYQIDMRQGVDEIHLEIPDLGRARLEFSGPSLKAELVSLKKPVTARLITRDGRRIAVAYADDGTLATIKGSIAPGNYYVVGFAGTAAHKHLRSYPMPLHVAAGGVSSIHLELVPAVGFRVRSTEKVSGTIATLSGVVLHRFALEANGGTAAVVPPGDYMVRCVGRGSKYYRRVAVSGERSALITVP